MTIERLRQAVEALAVAERAGSPEVPLNEMADLFDELRKYARHRAGVHCSFLHDLAKERRRQARVETMKTRP